VFCSQHDLHHDQHHLRVVSSRRSGDRDQRHRRRHGSSGPGALRPFGADLSADEAGPGHRRRLRVGRLVRHLHTGESLAGGGCGSGQNGRIEAAEAVRWRTAGRTEVYYLKRFRDFLGGITRGDAAKWRFEKSDQIFCASNFK
jgi:hypothetical protein